MDGYRDDFGDEDPERRRHRAGCLVPASLIVSVLAGLFSLVALLADDATAQSGRVASLPATALTILLTYSLLHSGLPDRLKRKVGAVAAAAVILYAISVVYWIIRSGG